MTIQSQSSLQMLNPRCLSKVGQSAVEVLKQNTHLLANQVMGHRTRYFRLFCGLGKIIQSEVCKNLYLLQLLLFTRENIQDLFLLYTFTYLF